MLKSASIPLMINQALALPVRPSPTHCFMKLSITNIYLMLSLSGFATISPVRSALRPSPSLPPSSLPNLIKSDQHLFASRPIPLPRRTSKFAMLNPLPLQPHHLIPDSVEPYLIRREIPVKHKPIGRLVALSLILQGLCFPIRVYGSVQIT